MAFRHEVRVRYADCDMQGVVFNANYLTYCDDAMACWLAAALPEWQELGFDYMLKSVNLTWHAPLLPNDRAFLDCSITRWGTASFDVRIDGSATSRGAAPTVRFDAQFVMVSVDPVTHRPAPVPPVVRERLG